MLPLVISAAVFVAVAALFLSFSYREQERAGYSKERLARATGQAPLVAFNPATGLALRDRSLSKNEAVDRLLRGLQLSQTLDQKLSRSDWKLKVSDFLLISGALAVIFVVVGWKLSGSYLIGAGVGLVALFVPNFLLGRNITKRRKTFNKQLVEVLGQMANSLKAGFGLLQAIQQAAHEAKHPISTELRQLLRDVEVGATVEDAFNDLSQRVASEDLDIVVTAILIQRGTGGSLSEILEGVTHTMRERIRIRGEIDTLTSQQKLTGYLIGSLPVLLGVGFYFINRPYVSLLLTTNLGHGMLVGWAILQLIGFFAIRRILNIEI